MQFSVDLISDARELDVKNENKVVKTYPTASDLKTFCTRKLFYSKFKLM